LGLNKPLIAVNHLEAHALTARLTDKISFPYLLLLVSGAHCQILIVKGVGHYQLLGQTMDDAIGEAFDKVGRMMGLGYPGGPALEKLLPLATDSEFAQTIHLPQPLLGRKNCDFSFSGLKTAVRQIIGDRVLNEAEKATLSLRFHEVIAACLTDRLKNALALPETKNCTHLVVAGGVAANRYLGHHLQHFCAARGLTCIMPPLSLCTDNAVMIAWAGIEYMRQPDFQGADLDIAARPRWPLASLNSGEKYA
jgi:N6-L-threonylcarbamoyladenine synthase